MPRIKDRALGRLFRLNEAAARGYLEDRIMDLKLKLIALEKDNKHLKDLLLVIEKGNILNPHFSIKDLEDIFV